MPEPAPVMMTTLPSSRPDMLPSLNVVADTVAPWAFILLLFCVISHGCPQPCPPFLPPLLLWRFMSPGRLCPSSSFATPPRAAHHPARLSQSRERGRRFLGIALPICGGRATANRQSDAWIISSPSPTNRRGDRLA